MKSKICIGAIGIVFVALFLSAWIKPADEFSGSERRVLAKMPELTGENVISGKFMSGFEEFALDQFPLRDAFRGIKAMASAYLFRNGDNNGLYKQDGHLSKIEYPIEYSMLDNAANRFEHIKNKYFPDGNKIYLSIIPSKHRYVAKNRISLDYDELTSYMREKLDYMEYIDVSKLLTKDDYYFTDSHWKQENILKIAKKMGEVMGFKLEDEYRINNASDAFYGVYASQAALPVKPDKLNYLTSDTLENCVLKSYDTGKEKIVPIYDTQAASGRDPYEMFMSGSDALQVLENPGAPEKRELVIFRDSFAASLIPLMAEAYSKMTLVDIRYIHPDMLGQFISFDDAEILFMYSTALLNGSTAFK